MSNKDVRILDEGTGAHAFMGFSKNNPNFLGTSAIIVSRPGLSDRLIYNHLIPEALNNNATIVLPVSPSANKVEIVVIQRENKSFQFLPKHIYRFETSSIDESANNIAALRAMINSPELRTNANPVLIIIDTLQKWGENLESQIRYLIQEASSNTLSVWLHTSIHIIPQDLVTTIGNVVIIWPSLNEINLLKNSLPALDIKFAGQESQRGLFIYNKTSGKGWQFSELTVEKALQL